MGRRIDILLRHTVCFSAGRLALMNGGLAGETGRTFGSFVGFLCVIAEMAEGAFMLVRTFAVLSAHKYQCLGVEITGFQSLQQEHIHRYGILRLSMRASLSDTNDKKGLLC